ncbi:MAG: hypothetical protein K8I27_01445 [Planctomycetes bacterium]|nr:hypothetical protein [Planctomycetota bacterium]
MKYLTILLFAATVGLCACQSTPSAGNGAGNTPDNKEGDEDVADLAPIVLERSDVQRFRGTEMVNLLERMQSQERDDWVYVRRHVHPAPLPPAEYDDYGRITERNYDWPPRDPDDLNERQRQWMSYELWPDHIRGLLHAEDWDSDESRLRLANYGRMYALLHEFQTRQAHGSATRETEYWRQFAESMLAYGKDGEELLVANMIVALSNPLEDVCQRAQDILVQVGEPAIEPLCAAMWTMHRQMIAAWEEELDPDTGRRVRTEFFKTVGNPNYNRYIADTLYRIGPRAVGQVILELDNVVIAEGEHKGKFVGPGWRYRKFFIELLGRFGDARALPTLEAEIDRVIVQEYDEKALAEGKVRIDPRGTDDANFLFHDHLIQALGQMRKPEALRPIIRLWKMDEFHENTAIAAVYKLTGKNVRNIADARALAEARGVDLKGE